MLTKTDRDAWLDCKRSSQVTPIRSAGNLLDRRVRNPVPLRDASMRSAFPLDDSPYRKNVEVPEYRIPVSHASVCMPKHAACVPHVFLSSDPLQLGQSVVGLVAIFVVALVPRRARTDKGFQHKAVN